MREEIDYPSHQLFPIYYKIFEAIVDQMDINLVQKAKLKLQLRKFKLELLNSEKKVNYDIFSELEKTICKNTYLYQNEEERKKEQIDILQLLPTVLNQDLSDIINDRKKCLEYAKNYYKKEMYCLQLCIQSNIRETLNSILELCVDLKNDDIRNHNEYLNSKEYREQQESEKMLQQKKEKMEKFSKLFKKKFLYDEEDINLLHEMSAYITGYLLKENPIQLHSYGREKNQIIQTFKISNLRYNDVYKKEWEQEEKNKKYYENSIYYEMGIRNINELIKIYEVLRKKAIKYSKKNIILGLTDAFNPWEEYYGKQAIENENPKEPLSYEYILKQINLRIINNYEPNFPDGELDNSNFHIDFEEKIKQITKRFNLEETLQLFKNIKNMVPSTEDKNIYIENASLPGIPNNPIYATKINPYFNKAYIESVFEPIIESKKHGSKPNNNVDEPNINNDCEIKNRKK